MSIISLTIASGILAIGITSVVSPILKNINDEAKLECAARHDVIAKLTNDYNEKAIAFSIAKPTNNLIELYKSKNGATWTIILTHPTTKLTCIVAYGEDWLTKDVTFSKEQKL